MTATDTNYAGPAHGEHPVVNGKAGAARASGSTPPSGITLSRLLALLTPRHPLDLHEEEQF